MGVVSAAVLPVVTFAVDKVGDLIVKIKGWVGALVPILTGVAVLYFIYGVITFIGVSDAEKKSEARTTMIQGIIGIVCILGLYGISNLLLSTAGVDTSQSTTVTGTLPSF